MDMSTLWPIIKPILAGQIRTYLAAFGGLLVHSGAIEQGDVASFSKMGTGIAIWLIVAGWSWWTHYGQSKFIAILAKMKPTAPANATTGQAVKAATDAVKAVATVLLVAFVLVASGSAHAQIKLKPLTGNIVRDIEGVSTSAKAAVTGQPAPDPTAALTCDFKMLTKLTPENLVPTAKACLSDANQTLVNDTQRALTSAKAYVGPNGGNPGDGDGINCLTPGLAIFKAGVQIPAVPAVVAADGTITTPAVPAQDPGPILLYQKYREFTLAGGLSACMTWFNGPIVATTAAGAAGAATAIGAAAALAK